MKTFCRRFNSDIVFRILVVTLAVLAFAVTLYPFIYVVAVSFSSAQAGYSGKVYLWPVEPTLIGYGEAFSDKAMLTYYGNTIYYTIVGTAFNMMATVLLAYPLSRPTFSGRKFLNFFIAFTMYFGGGMIPVYLVVSGVGLFNSRWAMILPTLVSTYNAMICRSAFSGIPDELIESAQIDGANEFRIFRSIAIRLITPTLAVLTLYYAVGHWNEFFNANLYLSKAELQPMQLYLRRLLMQAFIPPNKNIKVEAQEMATLQIRYVTIVLTILPILAVYPFIQKYFVKGIMLGAVKG